MGSGATVGEAAVPPPAPLPVLAPAARDRAALLDRVLSSFALVTMIVLVVWLAIPGPMRGLASADDSYFAEFAKTLANGRGYGLPWGSDAIEAFTPDSGSGPGLIVPLAAVIRVVGAFDALPGFVTLIGFLLLVGLTGLILSRRHGWVAACGFLAAMLLALAVAARDYYLFATFLGEAWTLGWLLVGAAMLSTAEHRTGAVLAGVALSLAYLTKQVGAFGAGAIALTWLLLLASTHIGWRTWLGRAIALAAGALALPMTYELVKLGSLGPAGYVDLKRAELVQAGLPGGHASTDALATIRALLDGVYQGSVLLVVVALVSVGLVLLSRRMVDAPAARERVTRGTWLWLLLWAGAAGQLVHFVWSRSDWPRYLWLAVMLAMVASVAPVVMLPPRFRAGLMAAVLGIAAFSVVTRPPSLDPFAEHPAHRERMAVVAWLESRPDLPWAGLGWSQVSDVAFSRRDEGRWSRRSVRDFARSPFALLVNPTYLGSGEQGSQLYLAARETCVPQLEDELEQRRVLLCDAPFWDLYLGEPVTLGERGGVLDPLESADGYRAAPGVSLTAAPDAPPGFSGPSLGMVVSDIPAAQNRSAIRNLSLDLSTLPGDAVLSVWTKASTTDDLGGVNLLLLSEGGWAPVGVTPATAGSWQRFEVPLSEIPRSGTFDPTAVTGLALRVDAAAAPYSGEVRWRDLRIDW